MKKKFFIAATIIIAMPFLLSCQQQADNYKKGTEKAMQVEAQINMPSIFAAQMGYKAINQKYGATFSEIGFSIAGENQRYTYFMGDDVLKGARYLDAFPGSLPPPQVTENSFTAYAIANLDDDPDLDIWTIDQSGTARQIKNDR